MSDEWKMLGIAAIVPVAMIFFLLFVSYAKDSYSCSDRWKPKKTEYLLFGGCRVQNDNGTMVPEKNIRIFTTTGEE